MRTVKTKWSHFSHYCHVKIYEVRDLHIAESFSFEDSVVFMESGFLSGALSVLFDFFELFENNFEIICLHLYFPLDFYPEIEGIA